MSSRLRQHAHHGVLSPDRIERVCGVMCVDCFDLANRARVEIRVFVGLSNSDARDGRVSTFGTSIVVEIFLMSYRVGVLSTTRVSTCVTLLGGFTSGVTLGVTSGLARQRWRRQSG